MLFHAKVNWWNEYDTEDVIDHVFVVGKSWNDATEKINNTFDCINSIEIESINDEGDMVFVESEHVDSIKELNFY